ncbi:MAG: hypothetical protein NVSMB65_08130 [Chloroflexota bacterium]
MAAEGKRLRVGVIFGSRSVEHEVSVITALQAMHAMDTTRYEPVPIYITKEGRWLAGAGLQDLEVLRTAESAARAGRQAAISPDATVRVLVEPGEDGGGVGGMLRRRRAPLGIDVAFPCVHGTHGEDGTLQGLLELADLPYVGSGVLASAVGMDKIAMKALFAAEGLPMVRHQVLTGERWRADRDGALDEQ